MKTRKHSQKKTLETLARNIIWMTAQRDETYVGNHFLATRSIDHIYGLDEAGLFDYLFNFMDEMGIIEILKDMKPEPNTIKRQSLDYFQFVILYIMKSVLGIDSMNGCEELLFTNYFAMRMAQFNARQINQGINQRGVNKGHRGIGDIRGAINNDTLANNIEKIKLPDLIYAYNRTIKLMSQKGFLPKKLHLILDATDIETTPSFPGCGCVKKEKPVRRKGTHRHKQLINVYGFKLWAVYVANVEIPVAIHIDQIQVHDSQHAKTVIQIALRNLSQHEFGSIVLDRGFLDGKLLHYIDRETPIRQFVIPAKANLNLTAEVRDLAQGRDICQRIVTVNKGKGKNHHPEHLSIELQVVNNVQASWFCADGSQTPLNKHTEDPLLHAVVIHKDETYRGPTDEDKKPVFLTNIPISNPFIVYDLYDDRSLIENELNRQLKQVWHIEHPPKRSSKAIKIHAYFSVMSFAITSCFRDHQRHEWEKNRKGEKAGTERYRRALKAANRDNVVIFVGQHYGIFRSFEPFLLADIAVSEAHELNITKQSIIEKYSLSQP